MTEGELNALCALSIAESSSHFVEATKQKAQGEFVVPYGGPYGYDKFTQTLMFEMEKRLDIQ